MIYYIQNQLHAKKKRTLIITSRKPPPPPIQFIYIYIYLYQHTYDYEVYLIALNRCKTDNFQFSESPIPASGFVRLSEERKLPRFRQRRRAASVLPPFHTSGGDSGNGVAGGDESGEHRVGSGVGSWVPPAWKSGDDDVAMFRALLRAMI